jgi:hypothetical protein
LHHATRAAGNDEVSVIGYQHQWPRTAIIEKYAVG